MRLPVNDWECGMTISWLADKIEQWPTAKLVPYARNARTHSDAQVAQIAARSPSSVSPIRSWPVAMASSWPGMVAWLQPRNSALAMVPVVVLDHLTPTQRRAW
jgi:hypothetical protein